jgi:hypothetical protein
MMMILRDGPTDACHSWSEDPDAFTAAIAYGHDSVVAMLLAYGYGIPSEIECCDYIDTSWEYDMGNARDYCLFRAGEVAASDPAAAKRYSVIAELLALCNDE